MPNPYLQQSANDIARNLTTNWQNNVLPTINSGAMMAGGFGGSRQGIAQTGSINGLNNSIGQAQTSLFGNAYESDQNRATQQAMQQAQLASNQSIASMGNQTQRDLGFAGLGNQRYGMDQGYNLSLGNLGLGQFNAETNRGLGYGQLQQQGERDAFNNQMQGANFQLQGLGALQGWNNNGVNWANQQQQIPLQNLGQLANIGSSIGGQGSSVTQPGASPWGSAAGGALTAAQFWQLLSKGFGG